MEVLPFTPEKQAKANKGRVTMISSISNGKKSETTQKNSSEDTTEIILRDLLRRDFGIDFPISGGTGNSLDNPIIIHKVEPNDYVSVEYQILHCLGIGRRIEWKLLQQTLVNHNNRKFDQLKIEVKEKTPTETITTIENYYFDITECMDF